MEHPKGYQWFLKLFVDSEGKNTFELNYDNIKDVVTIEMNKIKPIIEDLLRPGK